MAKKLKTILELNGLRVAVGNTCNEYQDKITDFIGVDCDVLILKHINIVATSRIIWT